MVTAKTAWLEAPRTITIHSEELGKPGEAQMLCATIVSVISPGTEMAAWLGLPPLRPQVTYPRLQGYCNVSRVLEVGPGVSDIVPGDRVLSFTSHRSHMLLTSNDVLLRLDPDADADLIACTYLFHLGYNSILRSGVRPGNKVMVIGMGALGLTTVALAKLAGAEVIAVTDQDHPANLAVDMGAKAVFCRSTVESFTAGGREAVPDVVVLTTNSWKDWKLAMDSVAMFGIVACLGFPGRGETLPSFNPLDSSVFYMKQLTLQSVGMSPEKNDSRGFLRFNERDNLKWLAQRISDGSLNAAPLISGRFDGTQIEMAYAHLEKRVSSPISYVLDWNQ